MEMVSKQNTLNTREMRNTRYPNGYLPKIAFNVLTNNMDKAQYFIGRQIETYGPIDKEELVDEIIKIMVTNNAVIQHIAEHLADFVGQITEEA